VRSGLSRLSTLDVRYLLPQRESHKLCSYATAGRSPIDAQRHIVEAQIDKRRTFRSGEVELVLHTSLVIGVAPSGSTMSMPDAKNMAGAEKCR
jgi:hypothetical protein